MRFARVWIPILVVMILAACAGENAPTGSGAEVTQEASTGVAEPIPQAGSNLIGPLERTAAAAPTVAEETAAVEPAGAGTAAEEPMVEPTAVLVEPTAAATVIPPFDPTVWGDLPVIPDLSPRAREILADGLARGNNPRAFSKIGDCESQAQWFLNDFDLGPEFYTLGAHEGDLSPVVEYYAGSFERTSLAARPGFTAASLMAPIWADKAQCEKGETPLACELRIHRPLTAFILVGTNDASNPKTFEGHLRKAIEYTIAQGTLPILGTKADNVEGDHSINQTMARLAHEYEIPLWNYWAAVQDLPGHGLQPDGVHLTFAAPHFDDPEKMKRAWPVRNLNALQMLREVMVETE